MLSLHKGTQLRSSSTASRLWISPLYYAALEGSDMVIPSLFFRFKEQPTTAWEQFLLLNGVNLVGLMPSTHWRWGRRILAWRLEAAAAVLDSPTVRNSSHASSCTVMEDLF